MATAACDASAVTRSTARESNGTTSRSTIDAVASTMSVPRFRLMSCTTPVTSSRCDRMGSTSIDFVR
jgi:hypothetical protein